MELVSVDGNINLKTRQKYDTIINVFSFSEIKIFVKKFFWNFVSLSSMHTCLTCSLLVHITTYFKIRRLAYVA